MKTARKNGMEMCPGCSDEVLQTIVEWLDISFHQAKFLDEVAAFFPQEHAGVCKTAGTELHLDVIAKAMALG